MYNVLESQEQSKKKTLFKLYYTFTYPIYCHISMGKNANNIFNYNSYMAETNHSYNKSCWIDKLDIRFS